MANKFFYSVKGHVVGPVEGVELRRQVSDGKIEQNDLIQKDGGTKWVRAGDVQELAPLFKNTAKSPPPLPPPPLPPPLPNEKKKKPPSLRIVTIAAPIVIVVVIVGIIVGSGSSSTPKDKDAKSLPTISDTISLPVVKESDEDAIKSLVHTYLKTPFDQRYKYVVNGESLRPQMADKYKDSVFDPNDINIDKSVHLIGDSKANFIFLYPDKGKQASWVMYLRKNNGKWLIDWSASQGLNPISVKIFEATTPSEAYTLRVIAEISDYYNCQYIDSRSTHYSIKLSDPTNGNGDFTGYVEKESQLGHAIFDIVKDGKAHRITVRIECHCNSGDIVDITKLVSDTWFID